METNSRFCIPVFDAHLAQMFEEIREHIKINAQTFAHKNLPPMQSGKLNAFFEEDHQRYQALIDQVNKELQFKSACDTVTAHKAVTESRLRENNHRQVLAREKHIALAASLKGRRSPYEKWRVPFVWAGTIALTAFDGILSIPIFETFGYALAVASAAGALFGILLAIASHHFNKLVMLGKTASQRKAIAAFFLGLVIATFYFMASQRAVYAETQMAENGLAHIHGSAMPFLLLSTVLFMAALALNFFGYPTEEQQQAMHRYQHDLRCKADNEAEQAKLAAERRNVENEHATVRQVNAAKLEYGSMLEVLIISNAMQGLAEFKKFNMLTRPDNGRPVCFDDPQYPYEFVTNFHTVKLI